MIRNILIILFLISAKCFPQNYFLTNPDYIEIKNSDIVRKILIKTKDYSSISNIYFDSNKNVIAENIEPWFVFEINDIEFNSNNEIWKLDTIKEREMLNGGKEVSIYMNNLLLTDLILEIKIQYYENHAFFREKLILKTKDEILRLTNKNDELNFKIGAISFKPQKDSIEIEELKIASWNSKLLETDYSSSPDPNEYEIDWRKGRNLEQNYMYHPKKVDHILDRNSVLVLKGPFVIIKNIYENLSFWLSYEHGAPDNDDEQNYITLENKYFSESIGTKIKYNYGAYTNGSLISREKNYNSIWYALNFTENDELSINKSIWNYLNNFISENNYSRKSLFYYNTWGMQRDESSRGNDVRSILTQDKVIQEIDEASQLGIDLFVLDDGWQDKFGDWNPDPVRFPNGLKFYVDKCASKNIIPGIWMAAIGVDPDANVIKNNSNWLIRDNKENPIIGRWEKNIVCFNSDYKNYFIDKCKELIDLGIRYFKWDGIDKHLCNSDKHYHGDSNNSILERKQNQGFSLPLEITDAIRQLKEYNPDVIVEVDVTEADRSVGLAILSEARYFWMNNGASWYGDYSTYRAKSMRMITNLFGYFMPTTLQTFANFPINDPTYQAQNYNVNSSLIGGRGFWGNLSRMSEIERLRVGNIVNKVKLIENEINSVYPKIIGNVGSSPEIYEFINNENSIGKIIGFSSSAIKYRHIVQNINSNKFLGVLNHSYKLEDSNLLLDFEFYMPDDSKIAIVLNNNDSEISIISSTSWLENIEFDDNSLLITVGAKGNQLIKWPKKNGSPKINSNYEIHTEINENSHLDFYLIKIKTNNQTATYNIIGN